MNHLQLGRFIQLLNTLNNLEEILIPISRELNAEKNQLTDLICRQIIYGLKNTTNPYDALVDQQLKTIDALNERKAKLSPYLESMEKDKLVQEAREFIQALLEEGKNIWVKDSRGNTLLHLAVEVDRRFNPINRITQFSQDPVYHAMVTQQAREREIPVEHLLFELSREVSLLPMTTALLKAGLNIQAKNDNGITPYQILRDRSANQCFINYKSEIEQTIQDYRHDTSLAGLAVHQIAQSGLFKVPKVANVLRDLNPFGLPRQETRDAVERLVGNRSLT